MDDDEEEPTIQIKLRLSETPQTKSNGRKEINTILANFQCGLPSAIQQKDVEFALVRNRKDKNQFLVVEDTENEVLYYDKRVPSHLISESHHMKKIGVFDADSNEVTLLPVTYSFNMKPEVLTRNESNTNVSGQIEADDKQKMAHDLVQTFGSKFAVRNMSKKLRLEKTKNATIAAMDSMDTAQLMNDKEEEEEERESKRTKKRKRSEMAPGIIFDAETDEYVNIFQHQFSKSPYCLFEFKYDGNAKKESKVYKLRQIIPAHIWKSNQRNHENVWRKISEWEEHKTGLEPSEFVRRCKKFCEQVLAKKGAKSYTKWQTKLVLYDICIRFLKNSKNKAPQFIDQCLWQNLKAGYLEQYLAKKNRMDERKRIKYSMTRRSKMRIVGVVLLIALSIAFWKISVEACNDIAKDLQIPCRVILEIYRLLGCVKDKDNDKVIVLRKTIVRRKPTTTIDGVWWDV